jgi:sporulation protein YlmC with PRC-barrel domain
MKVNNPHELVGKEVCDANGVPVGCIDKIWNSWNQDYPGYFFGIKPNENTRCTYFRGTHKLIPVYNDYIREVGDCVNLNRTMDELSRFWNKTVTCGPTSYPTDKLVEMPVYDKTHSRVGTVYCWVDSGGTLQNYGCFVDPYLCQTWNIPYNTVMPIPTQYIYQVSDTITLDKTLDELREYWKKQQYF